MNIWLRLKMLLISCLSVGEPVPLKDHITYILEGLGPAYTAFITSIQHQVELPILEDVRTLLISYDYLLEKQLASGQLHNMHANFANLNISPSATWSSSILSLGK